MRDKTRCKNLIRLEGIFQAVALLTISSEFLRGIERDNKSGVAISFASRSMELRLDVPRSDAACVFTRSIERTKI
jgi:hypothetical protein